MRAYHLMPLTREAKQLIRRELYDALGSSYYEDLVSYYDGNVPDEAWAYLRDREAAVARLLGID